LFTAPTVGGLIGALVFWTQSLSPSMMPRSWLAQSLVGSVCIVVGYAIGTLVHHVVVHFLRGRSLSAAHRQTVRFAFIAITAVTLVAGLVLWPRWQNDQRDLVGSEHVAAWTVAPMVLVTAVLVLLLGLLGRLIWRGIRALDRWGGRLLPRPIAAVATALVVLIAANVLVNDVVLGRLHSWANSTWGALEDDTDGSVAQPTAATVSGSPESLVPWNELGRQGRDFVAEATTHDELVGFHGADADVLDPIRVYVGLRAGATAEERAEVAVRELERTGAFDRKVLVVATVTGTGWVDPFAAEAVEQLWSGDTAIVGQQYSFLPSWISTLVDGEVAQEAGAVLFDAVYQRWVELPEASRPKLLVFGQSLGSFGAEAAFAGYDAQTSVANMVARTDGVRFTGPTNSNKIWRQITDDRDPGSPAWQPVFDGGRSVRFAISSDELLTPDPAWQHPRILYIQHASDPVTFWDVPTMWSPPEWLDDPKGPDIPQRASWFPFVTWAQGVADLSAGFGARPGVGHDFSHSFVAGWAAIAAPEGWTAEDSRRLETYLYS
jgi:uncharacterized membrane protein